MSFHRWTGKKGVETSGLILPLLPDGNRLVIPFYGGGGESHPAIASGRWRRYYLSDLNPSLVEAHLAAAHDTEELIRHLDRFRTLPEDRQRVIFDGYKTQTDLRTPLARAVRFLILLGCGYAGLWRENLRGVFNVPWNRPFTYDPEEVRAAGERLRRPGVRLRVADFREPLRTIGEGDVVYCDPWYLPQEGKKTTHGGKRFREEDHRELSALLRSGVDRGASCWVSNHDTELVRSIYPGDVHQIVAPRAIGGGKGKRQTSVTEVLIGVIGWH